MATIERAPMFTTVPGECRVAGCTNDAPRLVVGRQHTATLCRDCQHVDDQLEAAHETRRLLDRVGIPRRLASWTLDGYSTDAPTESAHEQASRWLRDYLTSRTIPADQAARLGLRRNLLLVGPIGVGKSSLAAAIAHELCANGVAARWTVLRDLLELKRESFDNDRPVDFDALRRAPVLILDDIGAERLTPWATEQLEIVVSTRYDACTPTVCTSNLAPSQLAAAIAGAATDEVDRIRARRIVSRLTEHATRIAFSGPDRRTQNHLTSLSTSRADVPPRAQVPTQPAAA